MSENSLKGKNNPSLANPIYPQDIAQGRLSEFKVFDIRDKSDYESAHIRESRNFSNAQDIYQYALQNKNVKILLVCYSGHTASVVGTRLVEAGCENIYYFDDYFTHFELLGLLNTQQES
ncbi:rhodanese-like domain-containing protein [Helicobacter himalayensis]|uniref:rhodanese-like domain-containing protein n=1 Tax=Helicobacter himalayensis TaxID=1591088 RepID=UPI003D6E6F1F